MRIITSDFKLPPKTSGPEKSEVVALASQLLVGHALVELTLAECKTAQNYLIKMLGRKSVTRRIMPDGTYTLKRIR